MKKTYLLYIFICLIFAVESFSAGLFLQTSQRRRFDEIHVEIWLKSAQGYYPNIAHSNLSFTYDTSSLTFIPGFSAATDSINANIDQTNPIDDIISPINSTKGLSDPLVSNYSIGRVNVKFNKVKLQSQGFQPISNGKGTYLFSIKFKIKDSVSNASITGIDWIADSSYIFNADSLDLTENLAFNSDPLFPVIGITILSPLYNNSVIDRDKSYLCLSGSYIGKGYPIYFERSINPSQYKIPESAPPAVDQNLAYSLDYDDGSGIWQEYGRFVENDRTSSQIFGNKQYYTDQISNPNTGSSFIITTQKGSQINKDNFRLPLRFLLDKELTYKKRYDKLTLKINLLKGEFGTFLDQWAKDTLQSQSVGKFSSGRIFFLQLNGSNEFLKTDQNISNSTQLTVEAWINLSNIKSGNSEPAIAVSSAGEEAAPVNGSKEGSWQLYLKDGKYPAFRVREIDNRGKNGYLADLVSYYPVNAVSSDRLYDYEFDKNWNHIAATVNNNIVKLYLNGELVDEFVNDSALDARMLVTNHPIWVGVNPNDKIDANDFLPAGIKGFRLWKVALTQEEIRRYASGLPNPAQTTQFGDIRRGLLIYNILSGDLNDYANDINYQAGSQIFTYYKSKIESKISFPFKPDNPHIKFTSPAEKSALVNTQKSIYEIRWLSYEIGDVTKTNSRDVELEYSLDGGVSWYGIKDSLGRIQSGTTAPDAEINISNWEPYQNNDFTANLRSIEPFAKKVLLKISGNLTNLQKDFYFISDTILIAPYFSVYKGSNTIIKTNNENSLNLINSRNFIELWIKPYIFPTETESSIPLISKIDTANSLEYFSLRLLSTGQLEFNILDDKNQIRRATSDINYPIIEPNSIALDTPWTHIGVYFDTEYLENSTFIRFYIDGNPQNGKDLNSQLGSNFKIPYNNSVPTYICSYPVTPKSKSGIFTGEIRELRYWKNLPASFIADSTLDDATLFIQGALSIRSSKLDLSLKENLISALSFNGGTGHYIGKDRIIKSDDYPDFYLQYFNEIPKFIPCIPYIKVSEPIYRQRVNNKSDSLRIRWVGFDYSSLDIPLGAPLSPPCAEYSLLGGGGNQTQPYKYVGSLFWSGNSINSLAIPDNPKFIFKGTSSNVIYAANLNISKANPDKDNNGQTNDQGALPAALTNARLRLNLKYRVFNSSVNISSESSLFTITPGSNFTVRIIPEGYFNGTNNPLRQIGNSYDNGGLRIKIFEDNDGKIGTLVDSAESFFGFSELSPSNINGRNNKFANVDFVFNNLNKHNYWVLVEHRNHLPVLSRFASPYIFEGDNPDTWYIESGWDFTSWNGISNNVLPNATTHPWSKNYYSAYGNALISGLDSTFYTTALTFSSGLYKSTGSELPLMISGDIVRDGKIDEKDVAAIKKAEASKNYEADLSGDGFINADDRILVQKNKGRRSSVSELELATSIQNKIDSTKESSTNLKEISSDGSMLLLSNPQVKLYFDTEIKSGFLNVNVSIESIGSPFYLGTSTIAFEYDTTVVKYRSFNSSTNVPFNLSKNGYLPLRSSPASNAQNALRNVRTIEIDFDKTLGLPGALLENQKTLLGTFRFDLISAKAIRFKWHPSTSINTTESKLSDNDITKDVLNPIYQYTLKLASPNGGEEYRPGTPFDIKWTYTGTALINLEYSSNNGLNWVRINSNTVDIKLGKYAWKAPSVFSLLYLLRISDNDTGLEIDRTDSTFSIVSGFAYFLKPAAIDQVYIGSSQSQILWASGGLSQISLLFSSNGGQKWSTLVQKTDATKNMVNWTVPSINTKNAVLRMVDILTKDTIVDSDLFKIMAGQVLFQRPKANETVYINRDYNIRWLTQSVDTFDLQISYDGGTKWDYIKANQNAKVGIYKWLVPPIESDNVVLRAIWYGDGELEFGKSDVFTIMKMGSIVVEDLFKIGIEIYPQPASDYILIKNGSDITIKSVNLNSIDGKIIKQLRNNSQSFAIPITEISPGSYLLQLFTDREIISTTILITR